MNKLTVKHSGGVGDIVYALPALLSMVSQRRIDQVTVFLQLDKLVSYAGWHPLGNKLLDRAYFDRIKPLLLAQPYITQVEVYEGQAVDIDLDTFRTLPINRVGYSIPRWYFLCIIGTTWDLGQPWLTVEPNPRFSHSVLVGRNPRLQSPFIRYDFMDDYADEVVFVGVRHEYEEFLNQCPRCKNYYEAPNFLELASVVAGCRLYVGNQGLVYTLAEALKIPRLLETNNQVTNNVPQGGIFADALFQEGFEYWFKRLVRQTRSTASKP
jgi:hypothetical protein